MAQKKTLLSRITPSAQTRTTTAARLKVSAHAGLSVGAASIVLVALSQWFGWHLTKEQVIVSIAVISAASAQLSPYISLPLSGVALGPYVASVTPVAPDDGHVPKPTADAASSEIVLP